ncbi:MAG: GDP-mannose 4,6-dehydratase [Thermoleophilia bacterium]
MKILVTGIAGFAGGHLAQYLSGIDGCEVVGLSLPEPVDRFSGLFAGEPPRVYYDDITDAARLGAILADEQPDAVMHLAAHAQVAGAWKQARQVMENNAVATQVLMQAIRDHCPGARVMLVGSGDVYGHVGEEDLPLPESRTPRPNNPYSVSKVAQEFIALQYHYAFGMEVVVARPFNHIGPRQVGDFITPSVARQLAEIEAGSRDPVIAVGNLDSRRDFLDVRDVIRAYYAILDRGKPGEVYNVCSGKAQVIRDIVTTLVDLSTADPELKQDPSRMRPSDTPVVIGDNSKLLALGSWKPEIDIRQSLGDVLEFWRGEAAASPAADEVE